MMYNIERTTQFKKDFKTALKRGYKIEDFKYVLDILVNGQELSPKFKDHELTGNMKGYRECHIKPDWLLVYDIEDDILTLYRTGTHSDIFN